VHLLTVDNKDGTIHIVKDAIYAPEIIIALISALKHSVEVLKAAKVFIQSLMIMWSYSWKNGGERILKQSKKTMAR